ncbi:VWA domain-containing protein [Mycobacterium sp. ITM-2016-00317]|uniref:nitric oxide reductase activation protein NorD n=1 Tax=Mycobacterium sp. ITM-2016-00317 TaxID=2099694 RepID=UPI00287FEFAC|nr:VWA domain-containing protein [Mycobacterium sp. ITM-2016-00317]WNG86024.1 VWA domain-containing protein [Mycobacterium sp. ITM-2016-00317]
MSSEDPGPERFRLLASFAAERTLDVAEAAAGERAYTDGSVVFVSAAGDADDWRREVLVQSALLRSGSLDPRLVRRLRGRPAAARRYLSLEGRRVLAELGRSVPLAADVYPGSALTADGAESLDLAMGRTHIDDPPEWFGSIRPAVLLRSSAFTGTRATDADVGSSLGDAEEPEPDDETDEDDRPSERSRILKIFEVPVGAQAAANFLRKLLGSSRSGENEGPGGELRAGSIRRSLHAGAHARPVPTPIRFTGAESPGSAVGIGGALYPEWDCHHDEYREDWCRVIDFPLVTTADVAAAGVPADAVLRRRLSRVGLGPKVLRARADGEDIDTEALIDLFVDLHSGHSPPEHVYTERRRVARNLGVLILLDASGSATDADQDGLAVHEHQRRAAAILAATLEELGDRVAVYGFRSQGRRAVHLPAIKTFGQRFGAVGRARLNQLQPSGYTRLGAGIRGAGEILKKQAGTPNRLLLVLSDGHPYDDGYEGRYAEADSRKALEELRADGMGCLCLTIGATTDADALARVFGSACHASGTTLAELSPRMDQLFLAALRELSAPRPSRIYARPS